MSRREQKRQTQLADSAEAEPRDAQRKALGACAPMCRRSGWISAQGMMTPPQVSGG